jgi:hypothetical protein
MTGYAIDTNEDDGPSGTSAIWVATVDDFRQTEGFEQEAEAWASTK